MPCLTAPKTDFRENPLKNDKSKSMGWHNLQEHSKSQQWKLHWLTEPYIASFVNKTSPFTSLTAHWLSFGCLTESPGSSSETFTFCRHEWHPCLCSHLRIIFSTNLCRYLLYFQNSKIYYIRALITLIRATVTFGTRFFELHEMRYKCKLDSFQFVYYRPLLDCCSNKKYTCLEERLSIFTTTVLLVLQFRI